MSFLAELKRRNVFRVGVAYGIVAWLIAQIISVVQNPLHLPEWFATAIIVLLLVGFPLAIFFAWAYELTPEGIRTTTSEGPAPFHTRTTGHRLNYFIVGVLVLAVAFLLLDRYVLDHASHTATVAEKVPAVIHGTDDLNSAAPLAPAPATPAQVRRSALNLGELTPLSGPGTNTLIALSADGGHLVYDVNEKGTLKLYHRALDQLTATILPGVSGTDMFFSPDGEWVGYISGSALFKVSIKGGPPQQLATPADFGRGGFWGKDGVIYYPSANKLQRVTATGGTPEPVAIQSELAEWNQSWPWVLPGGTHLLFTATHGNANSGKIALLTQATGETRILIQSGYNARYVPTGHIVFMRSASLWAVPFDVKRLETTGPEVPVINGVQTESIFGSSVYAFAGDGHLVYLTGGESFRRDQTANLVWVDRKGKETRLKTPPQSYSSPRLSPDGKQIALVSGTFGTSTDIWTYDLERETLSRRTFTGNVISPIWTPDGAHLVYTFFPNYHGLAWIKSDGTGQPEPLLEASRFLIPGNFSPDGSQLVYFEVLSGPTDIYSLSMKGERAEQPLLATEFNEQNPALSPDGRWLAYQSNETGVPEIYVRPYPAVNDGKWQVSNKGGQTPQWRGDGKELYYLQTTGNELTMVAVSVDTEPGFRAGTPVSLFSGDYIFASNPHPYDITADGQRFLLTKNAETKKVDIASQLTSLVLVENWFAELKSLAPPAK